MKKKFLLLIVAVLGITGASIAFAQLQGPATLLNWVGTDWIGLNKTVSSTALKSNLDYLYDVKAPKPLDCVGPDNFLGWVDGGWVCNQQDGTPQACVFGGTLVEHGETVTAYRTNSVPFGETCQSQTRRCSDGVLSGSYTQSSCTALPASSCEFNGNVVTNGETVTAYEFANVPFGETCQGQTRTCTNGTLSGSYTAPSCTVQPAATCVFNGQTIANGQTVTAYASDSVSYGQTCASETRTCTNGTLSGSYTAGSCTVGELDPARFYQPDFVTQSTEYLCRVENVFGREGTNGPESFWRFEPRDANNECPGIFSFETTRTNYHLQSNPGLQYQSNRVTGIGHDGLASDSGTLRELCKLKGYNYVAGSGNLRGFNSPGDNALIYGTPTMRFAVAGVSVNSHFNGRSGYVDCTNNPNTRTSGSTGGNTGGGPTDSSDIMQIR